MKGQSDTYMFSTYTYMMWDSPSVCFEYQWRIKKLPWPVDRADLSQAEKTKLNAERKKGGVKRSHIALLETDGKPQPCGNKQTNRNGLN